MQYEVISRFFDRARGGYVDPGAPCPPLDPQTAVRLVRARCIREVRDVPATPPPLRLRRPRAVPADAPNTADADPAPTE